MTDAPINSNDPLFAFSRGLDGDLTDAERAVLSARLAASAELCEEADAIRALDGLLKRWANEPIEMDWHSHAGHTVERLGEPRDAEAPSDDAQLLHSLLCRWNQPPAELFEEDRFAADVMARIETETPTSSTGGRYWRIGFPLAAAAAILLAMLPMLRMARIHDPIQIVVFAREEVSDGTAGSAGVDLTDRRVVVAFAQAAPAGWTPEEDGVGLGYVGSGDEDEGWSPDTAVYIP